VRRKLSGLFERVSILIVKSSCSTRLHTIIYADQFVYWTRRRDEKCRSSEANWSILRRERRGRQFGLVNNSIRRIAIQPARRRAIVNNNDNNAAPPVENEDGHITLSFNPRDIHSLWQEYEFGIGSRKAARLFTAAERGRVKYTYHRRKVVWDQVALMIRAGHTA
jgi:hypothetical protein